MSFRGMASKLQRGFVKQDVIRTEYPRPISFRNIWQYVSASPIGVKALTRNDTPKCDETYPVLTLGDALCGQLIVLMSSLRCPAGVQDAPIHIRAKTNAHHPGRTV